MNQQHELAGRPELDLNQRIYESPDLMAYQQRSTDSHNHVDLERDLRLIARQACTGSCLPCMYALLVH